MQTTLSPAPLQRNFFSLGPMRTALTVLTICVTTIRASEPAPSEFDAKSPRDRFTITQRWVRPDYIVSDTDCNDADCGWSAVLHFAEKSKAEVVLADQPEWYVWPAAYLISPDERWILRLQKTGSGENCARLYRVDSNGQVWRLEQHLDDLALAVATAGSHRSRKDYYHITVGLVSWDTAKGLLHLTIDADPEERSNAPLDAKIVYDLRKHKMAAE